MADLDEKMADIDEVTDSSPSDGGDEFVPHLYAKNYLIF